MWWSGGEWVGVYSVTFLRFRQCRATPPLTPGLPDIKKDWLVNRKHLQPNWHEKLNDVKKEIQQAVAGLEEGGGEVATWVKGKESSLHYYTCQQIMSLLEGAQQGRIKNIFGSYTSTVLKTWDGVLRAYRKDNLYLGEAARLLTTQTTYTCPGLRRRIAAHQKQVEDCDRRLSEYRKAIKDGEAKFQAACREWGIDSKEKEEGEGGEEGERKDWKKSLVEVARRELPERMEEVERLLCAEGVGEALQYYQQVWRFLHSYQRQELEEQEQEQQEGKTESESPNEEKATADFFPVLNKFRRGEKLVLVKRAMEAGNEEGEGLDVIDWGATTADGMTIERGLDVIDWGDEGERQEGQSSSAELTLQDNIGWKASGEDDRSNGSSSDSSSSMTPPPAPAAVTTAPQSCPNGQVGSLLADASLRGLLLNELLELEGFLRQRRLEVGNRDNVVFVGQYVGVHSALQQQSVDMVERCLTAIRLSLTGLQEKRLQQLWLVLSSPMQVDRVVQGLGQHRRRVEKLERARKETEVRRAEAVAALARVLPEYEATAAATKALKGKVEASLRELCKGKRIMITGGVNTL